MTNEGHDPDIDSAGATPPHPGSPLRPPRNMLLAARAMMYGLVLGGVLLTVLKAVDESYIPAVVMGTLTIALIWCMVLFESRLRSGHVPE